MGAAAYVGLGANLGDARRALETAIDGLAALPGTRVAARSSFYATAPLGADGPDYLNAVVALDTALAPLDLLAHCQRLENAAGRERPYRNAPRTLDLDLLLYGDERIETPALTVPHPRLLERAFVLVPLSEIAPALVSPAQLRAVGDQRLRRLAS